MAERILVVEDDRRIRDLLRRGLIFEGYTVDTAEDGESALRTARETPPDAVILDIMLPGIDGLEVCRRLRSASNMPILMLTARDTVPDRVTGLDAGADDYMVKPFAFDELLARVRALFRRHKMESAPEVYRYADLELSPRTRQVFRNGSPVELTAKEFDLLELFMRHAGQVLTREMIYEHIWDYDFGGESNIIEVYVRYLRTKLEAGDKPRLLQTVRGVGYALRENSARDLRHNASPPWSLAASYGPDIGYPAMTIRLRLTLWYTVLLGTTLILFSVTVYSLLATTLRIQIEQSAAVQANNLASALTQQLQFDVLIIRKDPAGVLIPEVDLFASSMGVQIIDLEGNILKRSDNLGTTTVPDYTQALPELSEGRDDLYYTPLGSGPTFLVYSVPLRANDAIVGGVQLVQPVTTAITALNQVSRYMIFGTAISLLLAAIVGAFLARRALAPIDTITNTASTITRTYDLGQRIKIADNASEVGLLAATFNEMLDRIQHLFQAQERLVGDVSHELRTPLTTIQGNVELLQRMATTPGYDNGPRAEEMKELLSATLIEVQAETERMSKLISDLLLLAQADSGALQLRMATVEMDTLLLDVYRQTRRLADRYKGSNQLDIRLGSEDQALVRGDSDRLRQVVLNLAENAVKYTPAGGTVTLSLEHDGNWVKISVTDTGLGISEEQQEHIFDRFYRTDKARSREFGGSGLGLSIAQSIAHAHQGRITVTSKYHQGSTFTLWLPALEENRLPPDELAADPMPALTSSLNSGL